MECYKKDYPRPQLVRDNWTSLNGTWDFCFDDEARGEWGSWYQMWPVNQTQTIEVPFTYETKRSGIGDERAHRQVWYRRSIEADAAQLSEGKHLWLHFEGSDFHTKVWVNGQYVGDHRGGYARFSFDITRFVKAKENEIVVKVEDSFYPQQPRGKQRWVKDSFGCWYVQTTGIWKTVWMEYVPEIYLNQVKMTPLLTDSSLELTYDVVLPEEQRDGSVEIEAEITFDDFEKLQFQVGEIIACEAVKKSKKLLCSQVRIGSQVKQIVSGIKSHYTPEEMVGKKVMVVVNLKPAKLAGILSEGMLLCAEDAEGNLALMTPEKDMPAGAEIC